MSALNQLLSEDLEAVRRREQGAFDDLLRQHGGKLVLFGAGGAGKSALRNLRAAGISPLAFADNNQNRWGSDIEGVPVLSPAQAAERFGKSALFVVTIYSQGHIFRKTVGQLTSLGVASVVSDATLRWRFPRATLPFFCHDFPQKVFAARERILSAAKLWSDDLSRREFENQIRWRALGDLGALELPTAEESYFPDSLFTLRSDEAFVDCGAYTGDTVQRVIELTGGRFESILTLEPDPATYKTLSQYLAKLPADLRAKIDDRNIAVGGHRGHVSFSTENTTLSSAGAVTVECDCLDDLLAHSKPTYIKMDIEGAELDALAGARDTIRKHAPLLAICVYHRQSDIWEIPLAIAAMGANYRYFLRAHEGDGWQTVLYAVPPQRSKV